MKKLIVPIVLCWILLAFLAGAVIALTEEITRLETELRETQEKYEPIYRKWQEYQINKQFYLDENKQPSRSLNQDFQKRWM